MTSQLHRSNSLPFFPANSPPSSDLRTPLSFSNTSTPKRAASPASSAGSHVSGVSHPPGSRKRRRSTIVTDVSSDELLSSIDKWDDGFSPLESSPSKSGIRPHSYGSFIASNNPFMSDPTRREYVRLASTPPYPKDVPRKMSVPPSYRSFMTATSPPPGCPTPTEPVSPILGSISRTPLSSTEATGSYKCTHPGCTAPPFQTRYILNSHANIPHTQDRPHFCPVDGCPRASGGRGFKRRNEMMRHGLVHNSPGYICPFCPDQQLKYPRPDNLQRHVRVHHVDKSKDDPILREVLTQRPIRSPRFRRRLSLQRYSWSCNNISDISAAFHISYSFLNHKTEPEYDWCGYCGENFPNSPGPCWDLRLEHLTKVHKFGKCSSMGSFSSIDQFHEHIRHAHNGATGAWSTFLGNACKREESIRLPPDQNQASSANAIGGVPATSDVEVTA